MTNTTPEVELTTPTDEELMELIDEVVADTKAFEDFLDDLIGAKQ